MSSHASPSIINGELVAQETRVRDDEDHMISRPSFCFLVGRERKNSVYLHEVILL